MKSLAGSLVVLTSLSLVGAGCGMDESDDLTTTEDALTCGGFHHGDPGRHIGHHHRRHHHHGGGGHLPTGNGGSTGVGGSTGGGGSTGTGGSGGGMTDPRCNAVSGMVSWWHADGDYDDAVGSNDGMTGGVTTFVAGETNQGFGLNGATEAAVVVPDDPSLMMSTAFTIDAWINPMALGGRIVDKAAAFGNDGYLLDLNGPFLRLWVSGDEVDSVDPLPAGVFTHVAGVFDGVNMSVFVNGGLQATKPTAVTSVSPNTNPVFFGKDSRNGSAFMGVIDEPRIFNRALSVTEVAQLYWQTTNCH